MASFADKRIRNREAKRTAFGRNTFKQDTGVLAHYDLVINTGILTDEAAARLIGTAWYSKFWFFSQSEGEEGPGTPWTLMDHTQAILIVLELLLVLVLAQAKAQQLISLLVISLSSNSNVNKF